MSLLLTASLACLTVWFGNDAARLVEKSDVSKSIGTTENGRLVNGKRLPTSGANFKAYSRLGAALGRNSVHGRVRKTVLAAYNTLSMEHPELKFVYGECSWPSGGRLRPHVTHRNGLSVDFMVPVRKDEKSVSLKTRPWNKFGYAIHFDENGRCSEQHCDIDFEAMALHLKAIYDVAQDEGISIRRVIFDPQLQPLLFASDAGKDLKEMLKFSEKSSWVRHDEHYHVDFDNPDETD